MAKHQQDIAGINKSWSMKGMAEGFNRYFAMVTAAAASLTGLVIGFKQVIKTFNDYEERVDNLSALTGLAGESLDWLSQKAKDLSTATLEGGIRVTQSAQEIIDAFTKTGSARPELLKNKEALVATTEEAIILSNAAKTELQPAIEALTMVMNQYNVPATEARRIINALAAGSKEGAGEIPYLTQAFEKAGTVAADAGISIETLVATIETLAPRITQPEIAGRSLKGVILDLQTGADDTNPAIVGLATALENLGKKNLTVTELTKKFGTENITTAKILIDNVGELKRYEAAVTGTNVALEQAAINTDNNNAKLAQAKNRLNVMSIELGEKLAPALQISTNGLSYFIKGMTIAIDFLSKHKAIISTLVASIVAYAIATKLAAKWEARANKEKVINIVLGKLQALAYTAQLAALALYNAGLALMKGNLAVASVQFRAFNAVMMTSPIGLVAGLIVAAGTALYFYTAKLTGVQKAQVMLNEVNLEAQKNIVEEKIQLQTLLSLARNEKLSKADRINAIRQLNAISPTMLGFLNLENINTKKATEATNDYTESLLQNAKAQAAKEKLIEIERELLDLQSGNGADTTFWQGIGNGLLSFGSAAVFANRNAASATANLTEKQAALNLQKEKLLAITQKQAEADIAATTGGGGAAPGQDLIKLKEKELETINARIATTPAEIEARNKEAQAIQNEIDKLRELGTVKETKSNSDKNKADADKAIAILDEANNERMARLIIQYEREGWTDERFKSEQLAAELAYLTLKKAMLDQFSQSTLQTEAQISQKRIEMQKMLNDTLSDSEKDLIKDMEESTKVELKAIQASIDASDEVLKKVKEQSDDEKEILEERKQAYLQFAMAVGQSFGDLMMDQEATFGDYLKNTILMALDAFHQWFLIEKMKAIIQGISGGNPVSIAVAIAKVAAMEIAYQGVRAVVSNAGNKSKSKGYASGGYTGAGGKYEAAGIVHKGEWVANAELVRDPYTGSIIAGLENLRKSRYSVTSGAIQASRSNGYSSGGYASLASTSSASGSLPERAAVEGRISNDQLEKLNKNLDRLTKWKPTIYTEQVKKDLDEWENIENNRGL